MVASKNYRSSPERALAVSGIASRRNWIWLAEPVPDGIAPIFHGRNLNEHALPMRQQRCNVHKMVQRPIAPTVARLVDDARVVKKMKYFSKQRGAGTGTDCAVPHRRIQLKLLAHLPKIKRHEPRFRQHPDLPGIHLNVHSACPSRQTVSLQTFDISCRVIDEKLIELGRGHR